MKRYIFLAVMLSLIALPFLADAKICERADGTTYDSGLNLCYPSFGGLQLDKDTGLDGLIGWLYYAIIGISGLAAFIMLVWGGIQWMSSAGNPTAIGDAKDRIQKALLGLLLVLSSFIIIQIINPELTILKSPL